MNTRQHHHKTRSERDPSKNLILVSGGTAAIRISVAAALSRAERPCLDVSSAPIAVGLHASIVVVMTSNISEPDRTTIARSGRSLILVGTGSARPALLPVARMRGCAVVDFDQNFAAVLFDIEQALENTGPWAADRLAKLARTVAEQELFRALSAREAMTLGQMSAGLTPIDIAQASHVTISTIRTHVRSIFRKLAVTSQLGAVALVNRSCADPRVLEAKDRAQDRLGPALAT